MFQNYLKIAWRNLLKFKSYSLINLSGLTIGIAVCILLVLWVNDELSYDMFHNDADHIYRAQWEGKYGDNNWTTPLVPMPLAGTLVREFPEVKQSTQLYKGRFTTLKSEEYIRESRVLFVDESFFDIFTTEILAGTVESINNNEDAVIITDQTAERYFEVKGNHQEAIGKTIKRNDGNLMQVIGVIKSFPSQSHLQFDFLASLKNIKFLENRKGRWGFASVHTYFKTHPQADPLALSNKIQVYVDQYVTEAADKENGNYDRFPFEPIKSIYSSPRMSYIWMFGIVAAFILILACINFINLTTARAITRAKEVGIRKVLGSQRRQLIQQFFGESTLYVCIAVGFALLLAKVCLPHFNSFAEKSLTLDLLTSFQVWLSIFSLIFIVALFTGLLPALVLSSFSPVKVIKGELTKIKGKDYFRKGLVIFQFCISAILIMSTLVVKDQLHFLQNKNMGFDQEQVLIVRSASGLGNNYQAFINQVNSKAWVKEVSKSQYLPGDGFDSSIFAPEQPSTYKETSLSYSHVDEHFLDLLQLDLVDGRNFNLDISTDSTACIINETAAKRLGWENPIGKNLKYGGRQDSRVIGVVKDFNFFSLHEAIEPLVLRIGHFNISNILIKIKGGQEFQGHLADIKETWANHAPTVPFEFAFLDDEINQMYESEQRMSTVFTGFTLLAIFIACLGLFGLAAFMAEQRSKEIGIRKVLGASIANIVSLLSKDFLTLVSLALIIAGPIAYYLMNHWLSDFAYRISISWWVFGFAAIIAISLAFVTVSFQSIKAALLNPIKSIRNQ